MPLDFPSSPANGQQYNDWVFDSASGVWKFAQTQPGGLPAGAIVPWAGSTPPSNWLICDGSAVSRVTYGTLFAVIGTTYGAGNGSTTFNLPDLRGKIPVGRDASQPEFDVLGETGGTKSIALEATHLPPHSHSFSATTSSDGNHSHVLTVNGTQLYYLNTNTALGSGWGGMGGGTQNSFIAAPAGAHTHSVSGTTGSTGSGTAHGNLQPYQVVNYIIKFSAAITPDESQLAPRVTSVENRATSIEAVNASQDSRITSIENSDLTTNRSGLVPIVPVSLTASGGSASSNSIGQVTATGVSSISLNGIFTSTYRNYRLHIQFGNTSATGNMFITPRQGNSDVPNNLWYQSNLAFSGGTVSQSHSTNVNFWHITGFSAASSTPPYAMFSGDIFSPHRSDARSTFVGQGMGITSSSWETRNIGGWDDTVRSCDGLRIWSQGGQTFTAVISVYGYRS